MVAYCSKLFSRTQRSLIVHPGTPGELAGTRLDRYSGGSGNRFAVLDILSTFLFARTRTFLTRLMRGGWREESVTCYRWHDYRILFPRFFMNRNGPCTRPAHTVPFDSGKDCRALAENPVWHGTPASSAQGLEQTRV